MIATTRVIAPEYCGIYLTGLEDVDIPLNVDGKGIGATRDCLNIGCLYWNDGDTTVTMGPVDEVALPEEAAFDGTLNTPEGTLLLFDANMPEIMSAAVGSKETRVRVWTNHRTEPDHIVIGYEDAGS
ncbi:MAG: hypothetical protein WDZ83_05570 [Rhizobiaceae bacterium]